ncbi:MAG: tetratricopeptide repeat protein [Chloroflexota bacterium]
MTRSYKLLGSLEIEENGRLAPLMKSRKGSALLAYLIVTRQAQPRLHIADLLWDASSTASAFGNLRRLLGTLRKQTPDLMITNQTVAFKSESTTFVDYQQLRLALDQTEILASSAERRQLDEGLQLYRGDLLSTFHLNGAPYFNEWLTLTRERLRQEVFSAYYRLCVGYDEAEAWEVGIAAARRWLALDDLHEETQRWLIRFLASGRQLAAAKAQYEASRARLWEELGVEPEAATQQLVKQLNAPKASTTELTAVLPNAFPSPPLDTPWQPDPLPDPMTLASPGDLPPQSVLPYQRNLDFTGRENELVVLGQRLLPWGEEESGDWRLSEPSNSSTMLSTSLQPPISQSTAVAITGMGGLGKTQLAVEFAYRYGRFFEGGVYWLSFAQAETVAEEIAAIGGERGMRLFKDADKITQTDQIGRVQRAWQEAIPRLLIFDNCEDEQLLQQWLPVSGGCRVLVTSRRSDWARELGMLSQPLVTLTREESSRLLGRLAPHLSHDTPEIGQIADYLGDLPLALHLAGSFLRRYRRITPASYLQQLDKIGLLQHPSLLGRASTVSPTAHELNVARTFDINFEQLDVADEADAVALQLLVRAACFAPGELIPTQLLLTTMQQDEADLMAELLTDDGLARLVGLGFLRPAEKGSVVMHRLLVQFTHDRLPNDEAAETAVAETVVKAIQNHQRVTDGLFTMPLASAHIHHIYSTANEPTAAVARLVAQLGFHYIHVSDYIAAQKYIELGVTLNQSLHGSNHIQTAKSINLLAIIKRWVGTFEEAWTLFQKALAIHEKVLEPNSSLLCRCLNNIGYFLMIRGGYEQAQTYLERALRIANQNKSANRAEIAISQNLLGLVFLNLGEIKKAHQYLISELASREQYATANNPRLAISQHGAGQLYLKLQDYDQAQYYLEKALATRKTVLGMKHLLTTRSLCVLGELFLVQAQYQQAGAYLTQALAVQEALFARKQPEMATTLKFLGELHLATGQTEQARPFFERALDILEETAVPEHPDFPLLRERLAALDEK